MNPFDLPGLVFLPVYLVFGICVLFVAVALRRSSEEEEGPRLNLSDPYPIAYLRGGSSEVLRLATVSLVDRQLLSVDGDKIKHVRHAANKGKHQPVEAAVIDFFNSEHDPAKLFSRDAARAAAESYKDQLTGLGLLPDVNVRMRRLMICAGSAAVLLGTAYYKIELALSRGKHNIGFLIILALILVVILFRLCTPKLTQRGQRMLNDLKTLLAGVRQKTRMQVDEAILVAAVFGIGSIAAGQHAWVGTVFPKAKANQSGDSSCGASCGSSCGSSSGSSDGGGSSCGSSCGGGGGCGGCGS